MLGISFGVKQETTFKRVHSFLKCSRLLLALISLGDSRTGLSTSFGPATDD
jgi:hypothetical protein